MGKRAADGAAVLAAPEQQPESRLLSGDLEGSSSDEEAQDAALQPAASAGELFTPTAFSGAWCNVSVATLLFLLCMLEGTPIFASMSACNCCASAAVLQVHMNKHIV